MLGIAIGVAAVILLTSIGEGTRVYMVSQFTQFGTNILAVKGRAPRDPQPRRIPRRATRMELLTRDDRGSRRTTSESSCIDGSAGPGR
jgi:putative ABC transport system permease protein